MTRHQSIAQRIRWALALAVLLAWGIGLWWVIGAPPFDSAGLMITPFVPSAIPENHEYWAILIGYLGLFLATQWLFLCPHGSLHIHTARIGRPLRASIVIAALMAMLLTSGLAATVIGLLDLWESTYEVTDSWLVVWLAMAAFWVIWALVFTHYWRHRDQDHYTRSTKLIRALIAGSVLELLVAAPAQVFADREESCYCSKGSYTGLVFGLTVLLWAFGPGVILLFFRERHRRAVIRREVSGDDTL